MMQANIRLEQPRADAPSDVDASTTAKIASLAAAIDVYSPISIQQFGQEIAERCTEYFDEILGKSRAADLDRIGADLTEIVLAAQQFDLEALDHPLTKTPLIGGLVKRFAMTKARATAKFDSVKTQVDNLMHRVETTAAMLDQRNLEFQSMYELIRGEFGLLDLHVKAIELRLLDIDDELARSSRHDHDLAAVEQISVLESNRHQLAKRADDLAILRHSTLQTMPMVRIIQSNNLSLLDKFRTIRQLTLPAWKRAFMLALTLDEQKNVVELATTIDNATNAIMRRNTDLLYQNSVATARANQRLVIDIDTLRHTHEKVIQTLSDVRNEHQQGTLVRRSALAELERLQVEMMQELQATGFSHD